jgi:hypothetical protein
LPPSVQDYVARAKALLKPDRVLLVQGGAAEQRSLLTDLVKDGIAQPVPKRENSYYVRTDPKDVARAEQDTFICSKNKDDAGCVFFSLFFFFSFFYRKREKERERERESFIGMGRLPKHEQTTDNPVKNSSRS